jgi:hypothetical protein
MANHSDFGIKRREFNLVRHGLKLSRFKAAAFCPKKQRASTFKFFDDLEKQ